MEISSRQKAACIALANGGSTRPVKHSAKVVELDRFIEELGVTVSQRCSLIKKMHIAKHHHRPATSPKKSSEVEPSAEELARLNYLKRRAELPGNPHHVSKVSKQSTSSLNYQISFAINHSLKYLFVHFSQQNTFPTVFPVRTINMVTGGVPKSVHEI